MVLSFQLILSRDVEENPGPDKEIMHQILDSQNSIAIDIKEMKSGRRQMQASQTQLESDLQEMNKKFQRLAKALEGFEWLNGKIRALVNAVKTLEAAVKKQEEKIVDLENRSRRNNLLVFGYPEQDNEDSELLKNKITTDAFETRLGISVTSLEKVHRIGCKKSGSCRPVILRLFNFNEKPTILNNCKKLK